MKHAFVFPGQGSQFPGMGKEHYENSAFAKRIFEQANELLSFRISDIMFNGTEEELRQTNVTQPAVFLHSVIAYRGIGHAKPDMVAGHSLGEFSALVANGTLTFEDALKLVSLRAIAMQKACDIQPSTMAAVLALADEKVEEVCRQVQEETGEIVVPANYNCPGQLVISGTVNEVVDKILALREKAGPFGEIVYAGMDLVDPKLGLRSMELMANEVMPRVNQALGLGSAINVDAPLEAATA